MTPDEEKLAKAIAHAVNFHSIDSRLNIADWEIGELLAPEVQRHLDGKTDVQLIDGMSLERRAAIGREN